MEATCPLQRNLWNANAAEIVWSATIDLQEVKQLWRQRILPKDERQLGQGGKINKQDLTITNGKVVADGL